MVDNVPELAAYPGAASAMIVDAHDPDCDGAPDDDPTECVPREFMGATPRSRESLSCVIPKTLGNAQACLVGGPTCADTYGDVACAPSNYCAPTAICNSACSDLRCDDPAALIQLPHISCPLPYAQVNTEVQVCSNLPRLLALDDNGAPLGVLACDPSLPAQMRRVGQPFADQVEYVSGALQVKIAPLSVDQCKFEITGSGSMSASGAQSYYAAIAAFPLASPADHGLMLPIVFKPVAIGADCNLADYTTPCTLEGGGGADPGLPACLVTPVASAEIVVD
jgi:hypothetical protein